MKKHQFRILRIRNTYYPQFKTWFYWGHFADHTGQPVSFPEQKLAENYIKEHISRLEEEVRLSKINEVVQEYEVEI